MSAASYGNFITAQHLKDLGWSMIGLGTLFVGARFGIRITKRKFCLVEDMVIILAWACLVALCAGYIKVTDAVYRIGAVGSGEAPPYPTLDDDIHFLLAVFFPGTLLLWCCLWLVKWSLLLNCRRLVQRMRGYNIVWWCIVGFCILTFIGCVASELLSCRSLHDWFTPGQCMTARDARASIISLFYAYAVDMASDMMIIAFPLRALWNLRISRARKIGIMSVFAVGILCMCASTIRIAQIREKTGSKQPSPSWPEVWAMVEAGIVLSAIIVACLPTFGLLVPTTKSNKPDEAKASDKPSSDRPSRPAKPSEVGGFLANPILGISRATIGGDTPLHKLKNESFDGVLISTRLGLSLDTDDVQQAGKMLAEV